MYPGLSHGAYECAARARHATSRRSLYLCPSSRAGEWTGTMCLTEPHCGTDLGLLRTKAEPVLSEGKGDGTYKITGAKIFISAGEHDMVSENILHLVLARLPDAPARLEGHLAVRWCPSSWLKRRRLAGRTQPASSAPASSTRWASTPTPPAQMVLEGRRGHAGGRAQQGPATAMFVMMNAARLGVGMQSLGLTEVAYQNAGGLRQGSPADARAVRPEGARQAGRPDHRAPRRAQDAAHRPRLRRRRPRAGHLHDAPARSTRSCDRPRRGRPQGMRRRGGAAHADRQGLHDRQRLDRHVAAACRCTAATASSTSGAWSSTCATRAST